MTIILLLAAIIICIAEVPPLLKNRQFKEIIAVVALLLVGLSLQFIKVAGYPSPISILDELLSPIGKKILK